MPFWFPRFPRFLVLMTLFCTVFSLPSFSQFTKLHDFNDTLGAYPYGDLCIVGNKIYGMTSTGGAHQGGVIFSMNLDGSGYKDINDLAVSQQPWGSLVNSGAMLYGMTSGGYSGSNYGSVFSIDTSGTTFKTILPFNSTNGQYPFGSLTLAGNVLYGMCNTGEADGDGAVFSVHTDGSNFIDVLNFDGTNGGYPYGSLLLKGNVLYGMCSAGGTGLGDGTVFSIGTNGLGFNNMNTFGGSNGDSPLGSLILSDSMLYGMTYSGGLRGQGTIFSIDTTGANFSTIYNFGESAGNASGSLTMAGNVLYGMMSAGGKNYLGGIFSVNPDGSDFTVVYSFDSINGYHPYGSLVLSGDALYGMCLNGGKDSVGVIFKYANVLGISENSMPGIDVSVYPNPARGEFTVQVAVASGAAPGPGVVSYTVSLLDLTGRKIINNKSFQASAKMKIDMEELPAGLYFVQVTDLRSGNSCSKKLLLLSR